MPRTGRPATRPLAAVERACAILDAFLRTGDDAGTNELARLAGIHPSSVSRTLATLAAGGYVEYLPESGRYRLGARLVALANHRLARLDLRRLARPHLVALEAHTGETATLSVPGEREAVTVDFVPSSASVASVARIGRPSVGHATAVGKVMLAFGGGGLPDGALERFTERTIVSRDDLEREVERVRRAGYARATGEREPQLNAVAAPLLAAGGELAGILGVQGPAGRFGSRAQTAALAELRARAAEISRALGYTDPARNDTALPLGQ